MTTREKVIKEILRAYQPHSHEVQHIRPREIASKCGVALRFVEEVFFQMADAEMIELTSYNRAMDKAIPHNHVAWQSRDEFFDADQYVRFRLLVKGIEVLQLDKRQPIGFV